MFWLKLTNVSKRLKCLTGLGNSQLNKLIKGDVLEVNYVEKRDRVHAMHKPDEYFIRPAVVDLIRSKKRMTLGQLNAKLKSEHANWK